MKDPFEFPEFIRTLPEIEAPIAGMRGWTIPGGTKQTVFVEFVETVEVPEHSHSEQWEIPVAGRVELRMQGATTEHRTGDAFFIPAGVPHGATVHAGYKAIIMFNEPDRYRLKG